MARSGNNERSCEGTDRRRFLGLAGTGAIALAGWQAGVVGAVQEDEETPTPDPEIEEEGDPEEGGERLSWHAGGTGGTYYPLSGEVKTVVEEDTPHALQVESTGASVENVGSLARGEADFALIQNDIAFFARNGTGLEEFEGMPIENLRGVASLYPETIHVILRPGADVESLEDLEGQRINTGDLGSGTQVNALQILETAGITQDDFDEQNTGFSVAADQIRDGDVDAAFVVGGWPVGAVEELATTTDVELLELTGETREEILDAATWFAEDTIPAGTYEGIDEDVDTVSVQAMIASHTDVEDDVVEDVTAAIFDNADDFTIKSEFIDVESALDGMSIELHPGAEAYFEGVEEVDLEEFREGLEGDDETDADNETAPEADNETEMDDETSAEDNETAPEADNETAAGDD